MSNQSETKSDHFHAVRFYKDPQESGSHTATLWTTTGIPLATIPFTNEIPSGWQQQVLSTPLSLQAGTVYIVSGLKSYVEGVAAAVPA